MSAAKRVKVTDLSGHMVESVILGRDRCATFTMEGGRVIKFPYPWEFFGVKPLLNFGEPGFVFWSVVTDHGFSGVAVTVMVNGIGSFVFGNEHASDLLVDVYDAPAKETNE